MNKRRLKFWIIGLAIVLALVTALGAITFTAIRTTYGLNFDLDYINAVELHWGPGHRENEILFTGIDNFAEEIIIVEAMHLLNRGRRTNMLNQLFNESGRDRVGRNANTARQSTHAFQASTQHFYMKISFATPQWGIQEQGGGRFRIVHHTHDDFTWNRGIRQVFIPLNAQSDRFKSQEILFNINAEPNTSIRYSLNTFANFGPLARFVQSLATVPYEG